MILETHVLSRIPGRIRIKVKSIYKRCNLSCALSHGLLSIHGIRYVSANHHTGNITVVFDRRMLEENNLMSLIENICVDYINTDNLSMDNGALSTVPKDMVGGNNSRWQHALAAVFLLAIALKQFVIRKSPLSTNSLVLNLAIITTVIAGYPVFRKRMEKLFRRSRFSFEIIITLFIFIFYILRESLIGLLTMSLVNLAVSRHMEKKYQFHRYGHVLKCGDDCSNSGSYSNKDDYCDDNNEVEVCKADADKVEPVEVPWQDRVLSKRIAYCSIALSGILFLATADINKSLAVLLAACPSAIENAYPIAAYNAVFYGEKIGIMIKDEKALLNIHNNSYNKSNIILLGEDTGKELLVPALSRAVHSIGKQNEKLAFAGNVLGVALVAFGLISPFTAAVYHNFNNLIVVANSSRVPGIFQQEIRKNKQGFLLNYGPYF